MKYHLAYSINNVITSPLALLKEGRRIYKIFFRMEYKKKGIGWCACLQLARFSNPLHYVANWQSTHSEARSLYNVSFMIYAPDRVE
jgi:hypothetical protein